MSLREADQRERRAEQQRKRRARARTAKETRARWEGVPPAIAAKMAQAPINIWPMDQSQLHSWERAPRHVQDRTQEDGGFDYAAVSRLARARGAASGQRRSDEANDKHSDLKQRYPKLIGERGAAKQVAILERERLGGVETDDEKIPSIRTLQEIFKKP